MTELENPIGLGEETLEDVLDDYSTLAICITILGLAWFLVFLIIYMLFC